MKIFVGCYDIASILSGIAEGFRDLGHSVSTFVVQKNKFYPHIKYDIVKEPLIQSQIDFQNLSIQKKLKSAIQRVDNVLSNWRLESLTNKLIKEYDVFVFIWRPWTSEEKLFKKIKAAGKKIICLHVGSDVRHVSAYKQEFKEDTSLWEKYFLHEPINEKLTKIRQHELFADAIFSVPDQEGLSIRGFNHLVIPMPNVAAIPFKVPKNKVPVIIHAPTKSGMKGTSFVIDAIEQLRAENFKFQFKLLENLPNKELISELTEADILVDELLLHGPGVLSMEAMAAGCIVATRTLTTHKHIFNPPVINVNPTTVYSQLKNLLQAPMCEERAALGRRYVVENNNPKKIAERLLQSIGETETDYTPSFYINYYELPIGENLSEKNKTLTRLVTEKYFKGDSNLVKDAVKRGLLN